MSDFEVVGITPKGSAGVIEHRWGHLWRVRDGEVASFQTYREPHLALAAADR